MSENKDKRIGNQWWKLRSKHGRDKIFKSPQLLWDSCVEYFEATDKRKWIKTDYRGRDKVLIPTDTPYTITGLCLFLDIDLDTWRNYKTKDEYKDFFAVVKRVDQIIHTQKLEGATVGIFNPNIVARELGLVDKTESKVTMEQPLFKKD